MGRGGSVQKLDFFQDHNGNGLVVFSNHSSKAEDIDQPPDAKPTECSPKEEIQPDLAQIEIMKAWETKHQNGTHGRGLLFFLKLREECLLGQLIHRGELADDSFWELVSDAVW